MSNVQFSERVEFLSTESAFAVLEKANRLAAQGMEVIHLEIGEPDFNTTDVVKDAAVKALNNGHTKYCPPTGLPEVREYIALHAGLRRGVRFSPEEIIVTPGAKPLLFFAVQASVNPGDEVIIPDPGFPIYESVVRYSRGVPKLVPIIEKDDNFTLDLDLLERAITPKTKAIILNSPHNPTGGIIPRQDMAAIVSMLKDKNILVISDEIYRDIYYGEQPVSIAAFPEIRDQAVIIDGFSKSYAMTGWRLGYGIMPERLVEKFNKLAVNIYSCTPPFVQLAGVQALKEGQSSLEKMVGEFRERRDILIEGLRNVPGFSCPTPRGAFYAFANVKATGYDSGVLANRLLEEAGVAVLDGAAFGEAGRGYLRFSYANSQENIYKAIEKMQRFFTKSRNVV